MTEVLIGVLCLSGLIVVLIFFYSVKALKSAKAEDNLEKYYKDEFGEP